MVGSHGIESKERLAARGESLAAFDGRCIPAGYVAPPSNTPGILGRRALPSGRLARLGATPDFHHGLLTAFAKATAVKKACATRGRPLISRRTLRIRARKRRSDAEW